MSLPFISIIIPVYNSRDYILNCLQSVAEQDYQGEMECLLIDDFSTDGTVDVIRRFMAEQKSPVCFRLLCQERNQKQASARNRGMKEAKGDYFFFVDSDDWVEKTALSQLVSVLQKYPTSQIVQAGIICSREGCFSWLQVSSWKDSSLEFTTDRKWIVDTCSKREDMIPMTPVCKLMSRRFIEENKMRFVEGIFHEDEPWLALIAKHLSAVSFCHQDLYHYQLHPESTTGGGKKMYLTDRMQSWVEIIKLFDTDFCPQAMLKKIDIDTSICFAKKTNDPKVRRKLLGVKLQLMRHCPLRLKVRMAMWILVHSYQLL